MAIRIEERFEVDAPAERVWAYLIDPERVVRCLPGAELLEAEDERSFLGRMKVKVGPVTAGYKGRARFEEVDDAARRVRLSGQGQETGGAGSARMTMSSEVAELEGGRSEVRVEVEMDVVGKLVQFGRGMVEEVSRQLFRQFAACVQATLAAGEAAEEPKAAEAVDAVPLVVRAVKARVRRMIDRDKGEAGEEAGPSRDSGGRGDDSHPPEPSATGNEGVEGHGQGQV